MEEIEKDSGRDMTPQLIKDLGMRYPTEKSRYKSRYGLYECQYCGKEFVGQTYNIKSGSTKSCGCQRGKGFKHGLNKHKFYKTWKDMIRRCTNPNATHYKDYGARGITVCEEWLDIRNFVAWAEETYPHTEGYTLDRIDNNKGYSPENCTWSDKTTQCINRRIMKNNKSGYVGVRYHSRDGVWTAYISVNNTRKYIGTFKTIEEAVLARDNYIIENKLPHKLSTEYKRED